MAIDGIQSVDRSLEILRIVAEKKQITATELARILGIHQSSASRHLKSLYDAGYIRKPDFHSFAPDYGILLFAGTAMKAFPLIGAATEACLEISHQYGFGAAVAVLTRNRLVYLSWVSPEDPSSLHMVDDSDFPVFRSSLGLILSYSESPAVFQKALLKDPSLKPTESKNLFALVDSQMQKNQFLYLQDFHTNKFNASICLNTPDGSRQAALAIFSKVKSINSQKAETILNNVSQKIKGS